MNVEFDAFSHHVKRGDDGVYRWYYDMDMYKNKSMLHALLKYNLFIFLGVVVFGDIFLAVMGKEGHYIAGITTVGALLCAGMSILYVIGFYIAAAIKDGNYRIHFAMGEDQVEIVWSEKLQNAMDIGAKSMAVMGTAMGSRRLRGRSRPSLNEVSHAPFSTVTRLRAYPKWDMIELSMIGGKFQLYALGKDFDFVKSYILERLPEKARQRSER